MNLGLNFPPKPPKTKGNKDSLGIEQEALLMQLLHSSQL